MNKFEERNWGSFRNGMLVFGLVLIFSLCGYYALYKVGTLQYAQRFENVTQETSEKNILLEEGQRNVDISFDFKFDGFVNEHEDLFQTAKVNEGIRMEFSNASSTGVWGIVLPGLNNGLQGINFANVPTEHIWHSFHLKINHNEIEIYLDDALLKREHVENSNFKVDDVTVGTGFSAERPFNGEIKNFKIRTYKYSAGMDILFFVISQGIFFFILVLLCRIKNVKLSFLMNQLSISIKAMKWKSFIVEIFPSLFTAAIIIRSTQHYLSQEYHIFCYEILCLILYILYDLWGKFGLKNYAMAVLLSGIFIFLKSFYIHMSYISALSDLLMMLLFLAVVQFFSSKISRSLISKGGRCAYSIIFASVISFLTMGVLYIRKVQIASTSTSLFGEELQAIFQTNLNESYEFIISVFSVRQIACILLAGIISFVLSWMFLRNVRNIKLRKNNSVIGVAFVAVMLVLTLNAGMGQSLAAPILDLIDGYKKSIAQMEYYQDLRKNNNTLEATKIGKGETYVVVIGESGNKRHYSAYGYFRDTTPWMKSLRQDNNALFLENAYSSTALIN